MTNNNKKVYLVYGGDAIPYEPIHICQRGLKDG